MADYHDFDQLDRGLLARADTLLPAWLPDGKFEGREYVPTNPTRADNNPGSFKINLDTGAWCDFATGDKGGGLLSLYSYIRHRGDIKAAAAELAEKYLFPPSAVIRSNSKAGATPKYQAVLPIPEKAEKARPQAHPKFGNPTVVWTYADADGRPLFYKYRFDIGAKVNGKVWKEYRPLHYAKDRNGRHTWRWYDIDGVKRPLYNLDAIAARPNADVIITEGEKAADAALALFPDCVTTTSSNGSSAPSKSDWTPLKGRHCILFPDNDAAGAGYVKTVARLLVRAGAASVRIIDLQIFSDIPPAWDAANALEQGHTAESILALRNSGRFFLTQDPASNTRASDGPQGHEPPPLDAYENDPEAQGYARDKGTGAGPDAGSKAEVKGKVLPTFGQIRRRPLTYDWLIEGWIERRQYGVIFGDSQTIKSVIMIDMGCCIATGRPWKGHAIKQGAVCFLIGEGQGAGLTRRLEAWRIANGLSEEEADAVQAFYIEETTLLPTDIARVADDIRATLEHYGWTLALFVSDTFSKTLFGSDRDNKDVNAYMAALDYLRDQFGCARFIVTHTGHADGTRERGASEIGKNADVRLLSETLSDETRRLTPIKVKDAEKPTILHFKLCQVDLGVIDEKGKPVTSVVARLAPDGYKPPPSTKKPSKYDEPALSTLRRLLVTEEHPDGVDIAGTWRHAFYERVRATEPGIEQNTLKQAFSRAVNSLADTGFIVLTGINNTRAKLVESSS